MTRQTQRDVIGRLGSASQAAKAANGNGGEPRAHQPQAGVMFDEKGKLILPPAPTSADPAALAAWLTEVFGLNRAHPIIAGAHEGLRGANGHVVLTRLDAPPLRFEPASRINTPMRLIEDLTWQRTPTDEPVYALKGEHCRVIAHVVRQLCGASRGMTDAQETTGIVGTFLQIAAAADGAFTTYGTSQQRYEAAQALRRGVDEITGRPLAEPNYLVDENTGELVIAVSELSDAARRHVGSSLPRGWLDARMTNLGWERIRLDGHAQPGREGRSGHHATVNAYRGHLPAADDDHRPEPPGPVTK
jgi:hypothetical protein